MILAGIIMIWLVSLCLHEYAHARIAWHGGDDTVEAKGYLTLNPLRYLDPLHSIILPLVFLLIGGIALPGGAVWIDTSRLRSRTWRSMVSLAGPGANVVMCALLGLPFLVGAYVPGDDNAVWVILAGSCFFQAVAAVLNLVPIPGLDGFGVLAPWLPPGFREEAYRFAGWGMVIFFLVLLRAEGARDILYAPSLAAIDFFGIPRGLVGSAFAHLPRLWG